jgi:GT2 family glycosyltransferase
MANMHSKISSEDAMVSVIVITHNGKHFLKNCFTSLLRQTYGNFVPYLLDNGSSDGSSEYVRENFPLVKILRFNRNLGFSKAYNEAIKRVNSKYIVLLNDDTIVDTRFLEELIKVMESDDKIFAAGSKIFLLDEPNILNHAGGALSIIGAGIDIGMGHIDAPMFNQLKEVGYVCGAAMIIRRDYFIELGGFDEDYFAYFEDVDLCWRAWLKGYKCIYVPSSIVYHKYGGSWGKRKSPIRVFLGTRNRLYNIIKNFELRNMLIAFFGSIIFDALRFLLLIKNKRHYAALGILRAYQVFLKRIRKFIEKRYIISFQHRKLSDKQLKNKGIFLSLKDCLRIFLELEIRGEYTK